MCISSLQLECALSYIKRKKREKARKRSQRVQMQRTEVLRRIYSTGLFTPRSVLDELVRAPSYPPETSLAFKQFSRYRC